MAHAVISAATVAWLAWIADLDSDGFVVFEQALDMLEAGMAATLEPTADQARIVGT
jgi:hypothetical protein